MKSFFINSVVGKLKHNVIDLIWTKSIDNVNWLTRNQIWFQFHVPKITSPRIQVREIIEN